MISYGNKKQKVYACLDGEIKKIKAGYACVALESELRKTASGNSIVLADSVEGAIDIVSLSGASTQGANPTPDNPQQIVSAGQKLIDGVLDDVGIDVVASGAQLFNPNKAQLGYITVEGDFKADTSNMTTDFIVVDGNPLTISVTEPIFNIAIATYNSDKVLVSRYSNYDKQSVTVPGNPDVKYVRSWLNIGGNLKTIDDFLVYNPMMNIGTEALPYEPYTSQSAHIDRVLRSIGEVKDELTSEGVVRRIGVQTLDGSIFVLSEPTTEPLTTEEVLALNSLKTYDGVTNIIVDSGDADAVADVEYAYQKAVLEFKKFYSAGNIVTYVVNGKQYQEEVDEGASVLSPKSFTPSKSGATFLGYSDSATSTTVLAEKVMGDEPITLYAVFKYPDGTATQTYKNPQTSDYDSTKRSISVTLPTNASRFRIRVKSDKGASSEEHSIYLGGILSATIKNNNTYSSYGSYQTASGTLTAQFNYSKGVTLTIEKSYTGKTVVG